MRYFIIISFLNISYLTTKAQSPWIPKPKGGYFQIGYSGLYYSKIRLENGPIETGRKTIDQTFQLYCDYGLNKKLGLNLVLPFKHISSNENGKKNKLVGLSNINVGLKYLLIDKVSKLSIGLNYLANTINQNQTIGLRTGYNAQTLTPFLTVGTGTKNMYFYLNVGYGFRTNGYSDLAKVSGEMGYKLTKNSFLSGFIDLNSPLNTKSEFYINEKEVFLKSANYLDRQLFNGMGIKYIYDIKPNKYGFVISTIGSLGAKNIPFSRSYNLGLYQKF